MESVEDAAGDRRSACSTTGGRDSLIVGKLGEGRISAFDPVSDAFLGQLQDLWDTPIRIDGLWGLRFGNGGSGGDLNALFYTAGIPGPRGNVEDHGLFGTVTVPEPGSLALLGIFPRRSWVLALPHAELSSA